ncbi:6924_t:CDS:2 [Cetraspora pellucida]|uniref:6924_t:CDS:1 n=1 Tax=Cetraspora pellucida TaxID=1433469 RepID=A0A9N9NX19_9GLOM|nr:6924_t:CDS:2 [Cetraspora pellucida]
MPYKDINKRREAIRKSVAKLRAKRKGITHDNNVNPQKGFTKKNERMLFQNEIKEWSQNITEIINNLRTTGKEKNETNEPKPAPARKSSGEKTPQEKKEKKQLDSPGKIKVDTAELEKQTGIKKDWKSPE